MGNNPAAQAAAASMASGVDHPHHEEMDHLRSIRRTGNNNQSGATAYITRG